MHDHDFEKQVHDKMEELRVSPSDAVWKQVEEKLHKKDRRRRFLWIPFFFAALITGGYFLSTADPSGRKLIFSKQPAGIQLPKPPSTGVKKKVEKVPASTEMSLSENRVHASPLSNEAIAKETGLVPVATTLPEVIPARRATGHKLLPASETTPQPLTSSPAVGTASPQRPVTAHSTVAVPEMIPERLKMSPLSVQAGSTPSPTVLVDSVAEVPARDPAAAIIGSRLADSLSFAIHFDHPSITPLAVQTAKLSAVRKVQWGISVQGGRTSLNEEKLNPFFTAARDITSFNSLTPPNGGNLSVAIPSTVEAGYGFAAVVFVRKHLSRRVAFSTGLSYTRAATSLRTGDRSAGDSIQTGSKNLYVNRYHFLEVPFSLEFQLNRGSGLPLIWEAGFSVSYLVTTNALHYNSAQSLYYQNSDLFNRMQLSLLTGLQLELFSRAAHPVRIGPQLQYGISRLLPESVSTRNHLLQYGFKISTTFH